MSTLVSTPLGILAPVTTAITLHAGQHTPVDATAGPLTMTLPTGTAGAHLSVEKYDTSANVVTVSGSIRGAASTIGLVLAHESIELVADAAGSWWPVAGHKTLTSLRGVLVSQGDQAIDLAKQPGVDSTGVTECAAAIQTALTAAAAAGVRVFARGTYKIATTVTITGNIDMSDAVLSYTGPSNNTALQVGNGGSGVILFRAVLNLPRVLNANKTANGWAQTGVAGTSGVKLVNCYACKIHVPHVQSFVDGLYQYGTGTGHVYNHIIIGHLDNNMRNERLGADATGWCNDNQMHAGLRQHNSSEGTNVPGVRQLLIEVATNQLNLNRWYGGSVEGNTAEYHLDCSGFANVFHDVRWEVTGGARVRWGIGAVDNIIDRGYNSHTIIETFDPSAATGNTIIGRISRIRGGSGTSGLAVYENNSSSAYPALTVMEAGAANAGADPTTAWAGQLSAQSLTGKRSADAYARYSADFLNGRVYFGTGTGAPTKYIGTFGTGLGIAGGNLDPTTDDTLDLGDTGYRWRYVRASRAVVTGSGTTASRPTATTAGVGAIYFDTDIQRMIRSNGTTWLDPDASSTAVSVPGVGGFLGWSFDPCLFTGSGAILTSGVLTGARLWLPQSTTVTNLVMTVGLGGSGLTAGQSFAALYSTAGTLLGVTADQSAAWTTATTKIMPLAGGPLVLASGFYDICFWSTGTTPPRFVAGGLASSTINAGLSAANSRYFTADTGLTTTAPNTRAIRVPLTTAHFVAVT